MSWKNESARHSMSSRGISTINKDRNIFKDWKNNVKFDEEIGYIIRFPDMEIDVKDLEYWGGDEYAPRDTFEFYFDYDDELWTIDYPELDESLKGSTPKLAIKELLKWMDDDSTISHLGEITIQKGM